MRDEISELLTDYTPLAVCQLMLKVAPMLIRGFWWQIWFRKTHGLILIGKSCKIHNPQYLSAGRNFVAEDYSEIQGLSKSGITLGKNVVVGRHAMIRPSGYYGREIGEGMTIGDNSNIGPYCYLGCSGMIEIGQNVLMGPRVSMIAENHNFQRVDIPIKEQGVTRKGIIIEDNCWLGAGCVILAGTHIGYGAIVAAGAIVTKNVPAFAIVGGVPAKVLKRRTDPETGRDTKWD